MNAPARKTVAIYCRKSTEEGLDREFNSLDAQRQCCEQFIASQKHEGWVASAERYDDGGFTGSNTERPALQRLLAEVRAGKVQVIAVYKLDRLSRSLIDFVGLLQILDQHQVAFVSVTQHFNTATPMGRLMLNILICFAQFERENMIERVRDKVAATKRLGKWCGGVPMLGYDVAPGGRKLVVNEVEADQVRRIFALYQEHGSIAATLQELQRLGWRNKAWTSNTGHQRGGAAFSKSTLARLLGSVVYTGRVRYRGEIFAGDHPVIVDLATWEAVQQRMASQQRGGGDGGSERRTKHRALLRGILRCAPCGCGMTYTYTRRGPKLYAYYTCQHAREHGAASCPMPNLPAGEVDRLVIDEIAAICRNDALAGRVVAAVEVQHAETVTALQARLDEAESIAVGAARAAARAPDDAAQQGMLRQADAQVLTLRASLATAEATRPDPDEARDLLRSFEPVWAELGPRERQDLLRELIAQVAVDGHAGKVAVTFRSDGLATLARRAGAT
jgi:site-specific DNA recombinase